MNEASDPDMAFDMTWTGNSIKCVAPGFGDLKQGYGNGAIYVRERSE
jgi:hypothetical protein